jgi:hypothetical protein
MDSLYSVLDQLWRNREELRDILSRPSAESVACVHCHETVPTLPEAVRGGWSSLQPDDHDLFLAICPGCVQKQTDRETRLQKRTPDADGIAPETNGIPETLACDSCGDELDNLAEALQEGWTDLRREQAEEYNYLGTCVRCREQDIGEERQTTEELLEALRFLVQEVSQPPLADSYVGDALAKAKETLSKHKDDDIPVPGKPRTLFD